VLGDIVEITDEEIGLDSHKAQIISKLFEDGRWLLDVKIDDNPMKWNRNV